MTLLTLNLWSLVSCLCVCECYFLATGGAVAAISFYLHTQQPKAIRGTQREAKKQPEK